VATAALSVWSDIRLSSRPSAGKLSVALVVLGAVLLIVGTAARYLRNEVATRDVFADHAVEALEVEAVRFALEQEIVAAVLSRSPQLRQARGEVRRVIDEVMASPAFRTAFRSATEELYRLYLEDESANASLKLRRLGALVEEASPDLARQMPRELVVELVALRESRVHGEVLATARGLRVLGVVLPVLAALAFSAAIAVARNRARAVMGVGVAAVVCAALLAAALVTLRAATLARIDGEGALGNHEVDAALGSVYDVYMSDLYIWALVVAAVGLVLLGAGVLLYRRGQSRRSRYRRGSAPLTTR
jgi:hypothetical protein